MTRRTVQEEQARLRKKRQKAQGFFSIFKKPMHESLTSVLPIILIVLVLGFTIAPVPNNAMMAFLLGGVLLIGGMGLFTLGAEMSMIPLGQAVGSEITRSKKVWIIVGISFLIGIIITVAEPDLQVLANQVPAIQNRVIIWSVAVGVGKTDVGRVRQDNQDDYRAGELPGDAAWALVCDGMGGARGGREASQCACSVIERCFQEQYSQCIPGEEETFLKKALLSANRYVFQKALREESLAGMGTTAVCALVRGGKAYLSHAGDSRAYLYRDGKLAQLTHDHSYVQELVDCGTITQEQAEHHPQKNIITRALGVDYRLEPEFTTVALQAGDVLLLCTDGLTNAVPTEQLEQLLRSGSFYDLPDVLIRTANENGGPDNITALLVGVEPMEVRHG